MLRFQTAFAIALSAASSFASAAAAEWKNVTTDLGGDYGWNRGSNSTIAIAPGTDLLYTNIGKIGFYVTKDGGKHWKETLKEGSEVPSDGIANIILFDPKDAKTFWVSFMYGKGLFKTTDAGKSFQQIGTFEHLDGVTVDFSDPERKTLVIAKHEASRSLIRSKDGGKSWRGIGMNLPEGTRFTTWPLLVSSSVMLTNTSGWGGGTITGIWRSEDCGEEWTKVSDLGIGGFPCLTSKGTVLYPVGGGLARSTDTGKTWSELKVPVGRPPIELPDGRLAAFGGKQLYISKDDGVTWTAFGPACPVAPGGTNASVAYAVGLKAFFACASSDTTIDKAIWRLDEADVAK